MGSGSSAQSEPKETQSAPPTARQSGQQPKRNRQFEEVQIAAGPGTSSRGRSQGTSPNPQSRGTPRGAVAQGGQDPGASGSTSERRSREQGGSRAAAATAGNGKKVGLTQ